MEVLVQPQELALHTSCTSARSCHLLVKGDLRLLGQRCSLAEAQGKLPCPALLPGLPLKLCASLCRRWSWLQPSRRQPSWPREYRSLRSWTPSWRATARCCALLSPSREGAGFPATGSAPSLKLVPSQKRLTMRTALTADTPHQRHEFCVPLCMCPKFMQQASHVGTLVPCTWAQVRCLSGPRASSAAATLLCGSCPWGLACLQGRACIVHGRCAVETHATPTHFPVATY